MMRNTFLSLLTGGIFDQFMSGGEPSSTNPPSPVMTDETEPSLRSKRSRDTSLGSRTPTLCSAPRLENVHDERAPKRRRGERMTIPVPLPDLEGHAVQEQSPFMSMVPEEVKALVLSFVSGTEDRFALQTTCKQFQRISNTNDMMVNIKLGGDLETGKNGLIQEHDTVETASEVLAVWARAGNLDGIYMLGMIKSYCHQDVERGIFLLKIASSKGCVRSSYALGLILRDTLPNEASREMDQAASKGYLPALQELLSAREMKAKYGEPDASELRRHLDPYGLNRLLGRHYLHCPHLRNVNTSHCWNPLCGRWAYKANANNPVNRGMVVGTSRFAVRAPDVEGVPAGRHAPPPVRSIRRASQRAAEAMSLRASGRSVQRRQQEQEAGSSSSTQGQLASASASVDSNDLPMDLRVSRMKMCSRCCRAKYCSKLCQVYDWRSGRHKMECQFL